MLLIPVLSFVFYTILFYANITFQEQLNVDTAAKFIDRLEEYDTLINIKGGFKNHCTAWKTRCHTRGKA